MPQLSTDAPASEPVTAPRRAKLSRRPATSLIVGALIAVLGLLFGGITTASATLTGHSSHPQPTSSATLRHGDDIPNVTLVENQIKAYYGDTVAANGDHVPSRTGNYAKEVYGIELAAGRYLATYHSHDTGKKAVVFDVDDTSLNTYNYEIFSNFAY